MTPLRSALYALAFQAYRSSHWARPQIIRSWVRSSTKGRMLSCRAKTLSNPICSVLLRVFNKDRETEKVGALVGDINGIITVAHSEAAEGYYFTMYAGSRRGQFVAGRQMRGKARYRII